MLARVGRVGKGKRAKVTTPAIGGLDWRTLEGLGCAFAYRCWVTVKVDADAVGIGAGRVAATEDGLAELATHAASAGIAGSAGAVLAGHTLSTDNAGGCTRRVNQVASFAGGATGAVENVAVIRGQTDHRARGREASIDQLNRERGKAMLAGRANAPIAVATEGSARAIGADGSGYAVCP